MNALFLSTVCLYINVSAVVADGGRGGLWEEHGDKRTLPITPCFFMRLFFEYEIV